MLRLRPLRREQTAAASRPSANGGASPHPHALRLDTVSRGYESSSRTVRALDEVSIALERGRFLSVMGRSGSGKTTFLQCSAGLDKPDSGTVLIGGVDLSRLSEAALTRLRRDRVGFVFQSLNLVPSLTVLENAALPLLLRGEGLDGPHVRERALKVLAAVGLADRAQDAPLVLSGGQQQRVAIARALVTDPEVIFADEPTGALDPVTAGDVLAMLREAVDSSGHTVVMVTHDPVAASWTDEAVFLSAGRIVDRTERPNPDVVARTMAGLKGR